MHQSFIVSIVDTELRVMLRWRIRGSGVGWIVLNAIEITLELLTQLLALISFIIQALLLPPDIIFEAPDLVLHVWVS